MNNIRENFEKIIQIKNEVNSKFIKLNMNGKILEVSKNTLTKIKDSKLYKLFTEELELDID